MATGNGDVYNIEYTREHRSNIDIAVTRPVDTTSVWFGVQLNMRDAYTGRAVHEVVVVGHVFGVRRCSTDRHLRGDPLTNSHPGRAARTPREAGLRAMDVVAGGSRDRNLRCG